MQCELREGINDRDVRAKKCALVARGSRRRYYYTKLSKTSDEGGKCEAATCTLDVIGLLEYCHGGFGKCGS